MTNTWGCVLIAIGMVVGFVYEAGMTYYVTWDGRLNHGHGSPSVGPDTIIISGVMGAFFGGIVAMAGEAVVRTIVKRRRKTTAGTMRQAEASGEDTVWPPPPKSETDTQ